MPRPFVSDEQLLGYIFGALDPEEHQRVAQAILNDETLRHRACVLASLPDPILEIDQPIEPPKSMVDRLMQKIEDSENRRCDEKTDQRAEAAAERLGTQTGLGSPQLEMAGLSTANDAADPERRSWMDALTIMVGGLILVALVGPAITASREAARAGICAEGMARLGEHIRDFAFQNHNQTVPSVPSSGPFSFAGAYAIQLRDARYLESNRVLWCPTGIARRVVPVDRVDLPSTEEFLRLPEAKRREWRHMAGGNYAYSLGMMVEEEHRMPSLDSPTTHAILADAPTIFDGDQVFFAVHFGEAANVLYDDGHVELLRLDLPLDLTDHPFLNREGKMEAGLDEDDSALGSSFISPLGTLR